MKRISVTWLLTAVLLCSASVQLSRAMGGSWRNPYQMPSAGVVPSSAPADAVKGQPPIQQVQVKVAPPTISPTNEAAGAALASSAKGGQEANVPDESPSANAAPDPILLDRPSNFSGSDSPAYEPQRGLFASDRAFPGFIGPISNPILSKDPRSLTEARFLFVNDVIPPESPFAGGNFQVYALQLRVALTDRLSLIADKDGIADIHAHAFHQHTGLLNMNFGLKYLLVRDVDDQFLWSVGLTYEPPMGEREVFENHGDGVMSVFTTWGKEVASHWHALYTFGYQFGFNNKQNSSFLYNSLHLDRELFCWLYPLAEVNWFHYVQGGDRGLPPALGEGDGLLNLGTSGVANHDLVTLAVGLKAKLGEHAETGVAWEFPLTHPKDLIDNRLIAEFILRY